MLVKSVNAHDGNTLLHALAMATINDQSAFKKDEDESDQSMDDNEKDLSDSEEESSSSSEEEEEESDDSDNGVRHVKRRPVRRIGR